MSGGARSDPHRVTVHHAMTVLGLPHTRTVKALHKLRFAYPPDQNGTYDARVLDLLRAMHGQPHRALEPVHQDWLARYLEESNARTTAQGDGARDGP